MGEQKLHAGACTLTLDAQKLVTQNARLSRLVRQMQEAKEDKRNG